MLPVSAPAGDFVLNMDSTLPVVLISGGVGITPMMSMLNTLIEQDSKRNVCFVHAAINSNTHAMKEHVEAVDNEYEQVKAYTCYSAPTEKDLEMKNFDKEGFVEREWLQTIISTTEAEFYFCGPVPFMKHINAVLTDLGVKQEHIHYEFSGQQQAYNKLSFNKKNEVLFHLVFICSRNSRFTVSRRIPIS